MPPAGVLAFGLVTGALAGLNSVGLVLLWRTSRVVNLAQPALGLVGGAVTGVLIVAHGWSFWWAAPVGIVVGATLSVLAERSVLSRLQELPRSVLLIATVGVAQIFRSLYGAIPFVLGDGTLPTYSVDLAGLKVSAHPLLLLGPHLLALIALPLVAIAVHAFLTRSRLGVAALALGQDGERARALGVPAGAVRAVVWAIAGVIGSISGILTIPVLGFGLEGNALNPTILLLALAPAVLAGLRSVLGAAALALVLGVAYQSAVHAFGSAGRGELVLVFGLVLAIALRRGRIGRDDAAARTSAFPVAMTVRPLPWRIRTQLRVRIASLLLLALAVVAAAIPPLLLSPSARVAYGTAAATTLGALGVSAAWMFSGELPLGHWGFAGLGVALAVPLVGSLGLQAVLAALGIAVLIAAAAAATRSHASLAFGVLGLAAAAAAPIAIREADMQPVLVDTRIVGMAAGVLAVATTVLLIRLRGSRFGRRSVAARDEPARARWLGARPFRTRILGLALSGAIVGTAGVLSAASAPAGITTNTFSAERSLILLAIAVIGGLGSPVGTLVSSVLLLAAERLLPSPWNALTSGVGVLAVLLYLPGGLARPIEALRDRLVRAIGAGDPRPGRGQARAALESRSEPAEVLA